MTPGWTYLVHDFDPAGSETEDEWAARVAGEGWRTWAPGAGPWVTINRRRVRRWSLRRWVAPAEFGDAGGQR
ncbi:hypothetical protein ACK8HX_02020 [Oryzobacter sp. R7]|uniref:hypothetical protein n=1 Tax=Oryzobacter faecalis TaxID=3388656 RepID=UPI00398CB4F6